MDIGKTIRKIRQEKGMKQTQLAQASGISQTGLSQIELGKRHPEVKTIRRICAGLQMEPIYLLLLSIEENDIPQKKRYLYRCLIKPIQEEIKPEDLWKEYTTEQGEN